MLSSRWSEESRDAVLAAGRAAERQQTREASSVELWSAEGGLGPVALGEINLLVVHFRTNTSVVGECEEESWKSLTTCSATIT